MVRSRIHAPVGRGRGFTLIELLVVIAIIALLVSILMPSLQKAKWRAKITACSVNMRSSLLGCQMYAGDFGDLPWNYTDKEDHDHYNPNDVSKNDDWSAPIRWYQKSDGSGESMHIFGEGRSGKSYWRGKLLDGKYGSARSMGCVIPPPDNSWELVTNGNDVEGDWVADVRQAPPFVYRGRACGTSADINVYAAGNIAFAPGGWFYEHAARRSLHNPEPNGGKVKIILNCNLFKKNIPNDNMQVQPHQFNQNTVKYWSELAGFGALGHIVAENVGWSDGHVQYVDSNGMKFRYVDPNTGKISATADMHGQQP